MMEQSTSKSSDWLDGAAVALSTLCLVHCLALPLIVAGLPFLAQFNEGHLHAQVLVVVVPLSIIALGIGYRRHQDIRIPLGGLLGIVLLGIGAFFAHDYLGVAADRTFTISGSLVLATAHFFNTYSKRLLSSSC
jgi:hypothetical protein